MSTENTNRGYNAVDVESYLIRKMKDPACTGEAALEIAKFLLQRLESESGDVAEG